MGEAVAARYFAAEPWEAALPVHTADFKAVADYTRLSFAEIDGLSYPEYLCYRRDSLLYTLRQSESGREILSAFWRLGRREADLTALHASELEE